MDLTEMKESGTLERRGKKEGTMLRREMEKLERLGGIKTWTACRMRCS